MALKTKNPISSIIFWALRVLTYGIPDILTSIFDFISNSLINGISFLKIKSFLKGVLIIFLSI